MQKHKRSLIYPVFDFSEGTQDSFGSVGSLIRILPLFLPSAIKVTLKVE